MDQMIAALIVFLVVFAGGLAMIEPVFVIIKSIYEYLKQIFLGPVKLEEIDEE